MANPVHRKIKKIALSYLTNNQGLTLLEVMISMVLFGLIVSVSYGLLYTGVVSYFRTSEESDVMAQLRFGMNRLERELREARWLTTNTDTSIIKFRIPNHMADNNENIPLTFSKDKIVYYYVKDGELLRGIYDIPVIGFDGATPNRGDPAIHRYQGANEGVNVVARNIEALQLTYLPAEVKDNSYKTAVIITLRAESSAAKPMVLTSTVKLRSQKGW